MDIVSNASSSSLAPGFRFHPTDEELIRFYLRRKVRGKSFRLDVISEVDVYKTEPWDLPAMSRLKTKDLEWYFFSVLDKKYGNGSRTNRATQRGYWKTTGKDRAVYHRSKVVGMKKTLVYHSGRAPQGERTNWVMHEYKLIDEELEKAGLQDAFVLCRIFQKSGSGPKNGEQYGAPFVEEEWEDDEMETVPKLMGPKEVVVADSDYLDAIDLEQILCSGIPSEDALLPLNTGDSSIYTEESNNYIEVAQKILVGSGESYCEPKQPDVQNLNSLLMQYDMKANIVEEDYIGESGPVFNSADVDYLVDGPFPEATDNPQFSNGAFLETNDLANSIVEDPLNFDMVDEYLKIFNSENDNFQHMDSDSSEMRRDEKFVYGKSSLTQKYLEGAAHQVNMPTHQLLGSNNDIATSLMQNPAELGSDIQHSFVKQARRMLGDIPAPPAFASEFPAKDVALHLNPLSRSSLCVSAGMIQIKTATMDGKQGNINIILSLGSSQRDSMPPEPMVGLLFGKAGSAIFRGCFYFLCLWVMILSLSSKFETFCAR